MALIAFDRLRQEASPELMAALQGLATIKLGDHVYWHLDDGGEAFFRSYELIRAAGNDLVGPLIGICLDDPKVFPEDGKQVVGLVVESLDMLSLRNSPEDYRRPSVGPCDSGLKEEAEIDLDERPKGLFVTAGSNEYIAHDDWLAEFASASLTGVKPVRYRGKVLPNWNRLRVLKRQEIIDDICFAWICCALCGQPLVSDFHEVWFAKRQEPVQETVVNTRGRGHYGESPIIVVSQEAVARFRKKYKLQRAGLRVDRVYSQATKRYEILSRVPKLLEHIAAEKLAEVQAGGKQPTLTKEQLAGLRALWKGFTGSK
jgi:hypothetical protein